MSADYKLNNFKANILKNFSLIERCSIDMKVILTERCLMKKRRNKDNILIDCSFYRRKKEY